MSSLGRAARARPRQHLSGLARRADQARLLAVERRAAADAVGPRAPDPRCAGRRRRGLLASLKRYRYDVRIGEREGWMCGIGAVFTPPEHRGERLRRGAHRARAGDGAARRARLSPGCSPKSANDYYARLGFGKVPLDEVTVNSHAKGGAPMMLVRAGTERDYDAICAMHATRTAAALFALRRDPAALHYALSKKRLFAGLSAPARTRWSSSSPKKAPRRLPTWCCRRISTGGRWRKPATATRRRPGSAGCCRCWPRASPPCNRR